MPLTRKHKPSIAIASQFLLKGAGDARLIAAIRCILIFSGLVIVYVAPKQSAVFSALTVGSLVIYGIWSVALVVMAFRRDLAALPPNNHYLGDVLFCAYLVILAQGTNSLFFTFLFFTSFLFAILLVFFSRGFLEGLLVTGASVILFIMAGLWLEPAAKYGFDQALAHPIYLVTLGYMASYWGGAVTQRRRMRILQEINNPLGLRADSDSAISVNMERIMNFYGAGACILVLKRPTHPPTYRSYYTSNQHEKVAQHGSIQTTLINQGSINPDTINEETAKILLNLPDTFSTCYDQTPAWWKRYFPGSCPPPADSSLADECRSIANLLDTQCFMTVPYILQDGSACRIFLTPQKQAFLQSDIEFLAQLFASISRVVDNMQLMDKLASESAKHERFRISLDIHDTMIQPYIGLKLGLGALNRQAGSGNPLSENIRELLNMTEATISDLRHYVTTLRRNKILAGDSLATSIKEQVDRFKRFYGIDVEVKYDSDLRLNPILVGAVHQIVAEGLSNIMRHTQTKHAYISMGCENKNLLLEIGNESSDINKNKVNFTPRSINARARSLGGTSIVKCDPKGYTVVHISIPLSCNPCNSQ